MGFYAVIKYVMLNTYIRENKMAKGIMSLEAFGLDEDPLITETIVSPIESAEELFNPQEETKTEIDTLGADINEADMTADTLEKMHDSLEASLETGGLNTEEVRVLDVAVEHLLTRVGFPKSRKTFPALEAFKERGPDRLNATKVSMESIKEGFAAIWKQIVETLRALWKHIRTFFKNVFDASVKVKAQAVALNVKANESKIPPGERVIKAGKYVRVLFNESDVITGETMLREYAKLMKDPVISKDRTDVINKIGVLIKEQLAETDESKINIISEKMQDLLKQATVDIAGDAVDGGLIGVSDKSIVQRYPLPFGHMSFWTITDKETFSLSVQLKPTDATDQNYPETLQALEVADVIKLADLVHAHMDLYKVAISHFDHAIGKLGAMVDSVKTVAADADTKLANKVFNSVTNSVLRSAVLLRGYDVKVAKAILDYGHASLIAPKAETQTA